MTAVSFDISITLDGDIAALTTASGRCLPEAAQARVTARARAYDPEAAVEAAASTPA